MCICVCLYLGILVRLQHLAFFARISTSPSIGFRGQAEIAESDVWYPKPIILWYLSGLRLGYVTAPKAFIDRMNLHLQVTTMHSSGIGQVSKLTNLVKARWRVQFLLGAKVILNKKKTLSGVVVIYTWGWWFESKSSHHLKFLYVGTDCTYE
jgi:Transcriptional regulators containing a DNA-binding HTH domain and an aminotransferase domain (MocR family) and their eukaryotic orthologs